MGKNTNKKKIDKGTEISTKKIAIILGTLSVIILAETILIIYLVSVEQKLKNAGSNTNDVNVVGVNSTDGTNGEAIMTTYDSEHTILNGNDITTAVNNVKVILDKLQKNNTYFMVQVGEQAFDVYVYNKDKECFAQSSDGASTMIYMFNDKNVLRYDGSTIDINNDMDVRTLMNSVLDTAISYKDKAGTTEGAEGITFYEMALIDTPDGYENYHEYRVEVKGEDAFKSLYSVISDDFANTMYSNFKQQAVDSGLGDDWEPHLIYTYLISNDENLSVACYVVANGTENINWASDGYVIVDDWELDSAWYDITKDDTPETVNELLEKTVSTLQENVNKAVESETETGEAETGSAEAETETSEVETEAGTNSKEAESEIVEPIESSTESIESE